MSTTEKTVPVSKGLAVRQFDGAITDPEKKGADGKNLVLFKYIYDRICLPWSRTGKDTKGEDVSGSVPTLSETIVYIQSLGFTTEYKLDSENNPETQSVVGFLVDGLNSYLNRTARIKAENTPESAKEKALQVFMSKTGMSRSDAEKFLTAAFAAK